MQRGHKNKEKLSAAKEAVDCYTNSHCQHLRECMGNSMDNTFTDIRERRVKLALIWKLLCHNI